MLVKTFKNNRNNISKNIVKTFENNGKDISKKIGKLSLEQNIIYLLHNHLVYIYSKKTDF